MKWFISDTHWGHENVIDFSNRPFTSVEEMNEALIDNWNEYVKPGDSVYHLGDFSFLNAESNRKIISRLVGDKHFIKGNHDKNMDQCRTMWASYRDLAETRVCGVPTVLCHFAMRVWNKSHYGAYMLYGHSHGTLEPWGRSVDVGVDSKWIHSEYRPTSEEEIHEWMQKRDVAIVDQHINKVKY